MEPVTIDFETEAIQDRPHYPPKPVGVSILLPGKKPKYYAWGHPEGNNCTFQDARQALLAAYGTKNRKLFHNSKFDVEVAHVHMGVRMLSWDEIEDTLFLLFLNNPHAKSLSLKPAAEAYLGMPPEEQDDVKDWVMANVPGAKLSDWGAYICKAPAQIVGPYANGDVERTYRLFKELRPVIAECGMDAAYNRERRLMPILLENERVGIRVDTASLSRDLDSFRAAVVVAEKFLFKHLGGSFNLDSDEEKAERLERHGVVTEWAMTPTGRRSTSKKNMTLDKFNDPKIASALGYRDRLCTCIRMFGENWLQMAEAGDGYIHTNWNQVRQTNDRNSFSGTRTGRPSTSNPNFLNISKTWMDKDDHYAHPKFLKVPELPLMRKYLLPDPGHVFLHRDYNQQELRALAHFEDGALMKMYQENPRMDIHAFVSKEVARLRGMELPRRPAKITVFRRIYGGGAPATAQALNCSIDVARRVIGAIEAAIPGLKDLDKELKAIGRSGGAIRTWGGRTYYCEPPSYSKKYKRDMTYEYKLLNYLIQGSSADATKESIIRYDDTRKGSRFLVSVYDESNISAPIGTAKREMNTLREAMESVEFDVPMLTEGKSGPSWGELKEYKDAN